MKEKWKVKCEGRNVEREGCSQGSCELPKERYNVKHNLYGRPTSPWKPCGRNLQALPLERIIVKINMRNKIGLPNDLDREPSLNKKCAHLKMNIFICLKLIPFPMLQSAKQGLVCVGLSSHQNPLAADMSESSLKVFPYIKVSLYRNNSKCQP